MKFVYNVTAHYLTSGICGKEVIIKTFINKNEAKQIAQKLDNEAEKNNDFIWYYVHKKIKK